MSKAERNKQAKKEKQRIQMHARLIRQEIVNYFMIFVVAQVMQDQQMQEVLNALAERLRLLGFDEEMIGVELNAFATNVQAVQTAKIEKPINGDGADA